MRTRVGIVGHRGYSGAELVRLLGRHPLVDPVLLDPRKEAIPAEKLAAVFLATPADVSMQLALAMLDTGAKVIDLSGAFRLESPQAFAAWYNEPHIQPALLAEAVYGLPERHRARIPAARLVANPGCYPTAANLAIQPLVEAGVVDRQAGIVCDAKSGVSGAGRKPSLQTSFCEVAENFSAYAVLNHRHVPEILMISGLEEHEISFTAQLLPLERGILETIYFRSAILKSAADLHSIYESRYQGEPFVRLHAPGDFPDLRAVQRTNFCDLGMTFDPKTGRGVVVSAIDNLGKGAAGQAIQNMNLLLGFEETEGLL